MYLFIYKTIHPSGRYYIGRHITDDINDGYYGSGKWVSNIKDKSTLSREILCEANTEEELHKLEQYYIDQHWDDPLCMNLLKSSAGWTSVDAKLLANTRDWNQTMNNFRNTMMDRYGYCHPSQVPDIKTKKTNTMLSKYGITNPGQTQASKDKAKARMVLSNTGYVACYDITTNTYCKIPKEEFHAHKGIRYVGVNSKIARSRGQ